MGGGKGIWCRAFAVPASGLGKKILAMKAILGRRILLFSN